MDNRPYIRECVLPLLLGGGTHPLSVEGHSQMGKQDLDFAEPILWACPQCGSEYLTVELQPRCHLYGYWEGT